MSPRGPTQVKLCQTAKEDSVLNKDWSVKAELVTDKRYILRASHLPSQHLGWITGEHPEHEE
jgi:hypothetical protein